MEERLLESILLLIVGMTGVFSSLIVLAALIWLIRQTDEALNRWRILDYSRKLEQQKVDSDVNDELVAVLAAAAATTMSKPVFVRRIRFLDREVTPSWAVTGRVNIMASHSIQKGKPS